MNSEPAERPVCLLYAPYNCTCPACFALCRVRFFPPFVWPVYHASRHLHVHANEHRECLLVHTVCAAPTERVSESAHANTEADSKVLWGRRMASLPLIYHWQRRFQMGWPLRSCRLCRRGCSKCCPQVFACAPSPRVRACACPHVLKCKLHLATRVDVPACWAAGRPPHLLTCVEVLVSID